MRFFTLLLDPNDRGIGEDVRRSYEVLPRRHGLGLEWQVFDHAAVLTAWDDSWGDPLVIKYGTHLAVGMVRLDNRADLERWAECDGEELTDLGLVLRIVALHGTKYIPQVLGDFGFVVWHAPTRQLVAAVDAFGVKNLYYGDKGELVAFSSRAEPLWRDATYDTGFLAEVVSAGMGLPDRTVYHHVQRILPGSIVGFRGNKLIIEVYWSPSDARLGTEYRGSEIQAIETCRHLASDGVRCAIGDDDHTWAQLSGGLDSSSVVSMAQWHVERGSARRGLAGTVTYVDGEGSAGDEREYSQAVVDRWHVRNEVIVNAPVWDDQAAKLPWFDQPTFNLLVYPREQRLTVLLRQAGARALATGVGGDELFTGNGFFLADRITHGRIIQTLREMARRAASRRLSFWELGYRTVLLPLLPRAVQHHLLIDDVRLPAWLTQTAIRQSEVEERLFVVSAVEGSMGHKYRHAFIRTLEALRSMRGYGTLDDAFEVRHPFLYRPLVEFALGLAPELCTKPEARKWVLREAMRGILPEVVRERTGKGNPQSVMTSALSTQRAVLEPLVQEPILADLGVIDAGRFRAAFNAAPHQPERKSALQGMVMVTLMIEAWLQLRAGRWPRRAE